MEKLKGTGVAVVTPFRGGSIDHRALTGIIEYVIEGGVDYLVCLGTTGESSTLTLPESQSVLATFQRVVDGRLPLVLGALGGNDTAALIRRFSDFDLKGVVALLSSSPAYNKPSQQGIFEHYQALSAASPLPLIIYNVPGRTCTNISAETTLRIATSCEQVIGIKDAAADMMQASILVKNKPEGFLVLSGDDPTVLSMMAVGADGVISVIANAYPREFADMVRACLAEKFDEARLLHLSLLEIHPWLYAEGNPTGVKAAMEILGLCSREMRLPLVSMTEDSVQNLRKKMDQVGAKK